MTSIDAGGQSGPRVPPNSSAVKTDTAESRRHPDRLTADGGRRSSRAGQLIDGLIDRVHQEWPSTTFILELPTGEQVLLPRHAVGLEPCRESHAGYFSSVVRPLCAAAPTPRSRGWCWMVPLRDSQTQPPDYCLELRSGMVTTSGATTESQGT